MSRDMTNAEAISNLNHIYGVVSPDIQRSLDVAFKALETPTIYEFKGCDNCELERPKGEWIRTGSLGNGNARYECSKCHYSDDHAESQEVPYCWHCGADMRGEEE